MSPEARRPRLTKSSAAVLAGVCGGIAEFLGWEPRSVRYLWAGVTLLTGIVPGAVGYAVLSIVMPGRGEGGDALRLEDHRSG